MTPRRTPDAVRLPRTLRLIGAIAAGAALLLGSRAVGAQELAAFAGVYTYAGGQQQRDAVASAIDAIVADMNPLFRTVAKRRLTAGASIPSRYSFTPGPAATLTVTVDSGRPLTTTLDGTPIRFKNAEGQSVSLRRTWKNGVLTSHADRGDAAQKNVFRLSPDAKVLSVTFIITSDPLPRPLRYDLSYRRQE